MSVMESVNVNQFHRLATSETIAVSMHHARLTTGEHFKMIIKLKILIKSSTEPQHTSAHAMMVTSAMVSFAPWNETATTSQNCAMKTQTVLQLQMDGNVFAIKVIF